MAIGVALSCHLCNLDKNIVTMKSLIHVKCSPCKCYFELCVSDEIYQIVQYTI